MNTIVPQTTNGSAASLHVLHVNCYRDPLERAPDELLKAWPTLTNVAAAAACSMVRVSVLQAAAHDNVREREGVKVNFIAEQKPGFVRQRLGFWAYPMPRRLAMRALELAPVLIHFHGLSFPLHVRLFQRTLPGVPILVQDHADRSPPWWRRLPYKRGLAEVDAVAFTARDQAGPFQQSGILRPGTAVFEILESSSHFSPGDQAAARQETGVFGNPCYLWVGRLDGNKDPLTVLEAFRKAIPALEDPHLWCCFSDAPLLRRVEARLAAEPALASRVHLLGQVRHDQVQQLCRAADFFVLGSHREGSGYAVLEALACGLTPLVTDIPSLRKITGTGAVGALSPPGNADVMARAMVEWSTRDRSGLRENARAHFEQYLSFAVLGEQLRAAYRSMLASR